VCIKHNKYTPIISALHNNRDHRKITIIDGVVAFTGGINIADEYINKKQPFGHWKDYGLMIEGDAVQSMTLEFLNMFFTQTGVVENTQKYLCSHKQFSKAPNGVVIPFFDGPSPLYQDRVGENAYINIINQAKNYVYITTPYLIVDYNFMSALKLAAKRGVEVCIITPHKPDKKIIFLQTQASYKRLLAEGVKIFEYTPGFMHGKAIVSDDKFAIIGTFNVDYRSFVHHFENGVLLCGTNSVLDIKKEIQKTMQICKQIKIGNYNFGLIRKFVSDIISIFSPLM
jgi:cardiolipin synthase